MIAAQLKYKAFLRHIKDLKNGLLRIWLTWFSMIHIPCNEKGQRRFHSLAVSSHLRRK